MSSIHFLSAGVNPAERSNFGSLNSKMPVSSCGENKYVSTLPSMSRRHVHRLTLISKSTSFCWVTIEFVLPHSQLRVSLSISSCCSGRYGWKNASCISKKSVYGQLKHIKIQYHTLPNKSSGSPIYAIMLFESDVRSSVGLERPWALLHSGGDPQSSRFCRSPGTSVTSEYWYVHNFSTG